MSLKSRKLFAVVACLSCVAAGAHSASDAYLTLTADVASPAQALIHGQWDIALRDLDFVLQLNAHGDGRVTWGEVRRHRAAIERYAYAHLRVDAGAGNPCAIKPLKLLVDAHADGAYAALFFDVACAITPTRLEVGYDLFFAIDPSHRGILVLHHAGGIATSVLSPKNAAVGLVL